MPVLLMPADTLAKTVSSDPATYQLHDLFGAYIRVGEEIETRLRTLNIQWPLIGLEPRIETGEITEGQFLLYVTTCWHGQLLNGGVFGFLENCPGLVRDARSALRRFAPPAFRTQWEALVEPAHRVLDESAGYDGNPTDPEIAAVWANYEAALDEMDEDRVKQFEDSIYAEGAKDNAEHPVNVFAQGIVDFVVANPGQLKLL